MNEPAASDLQSTGSTVLDDVAEVIGRRAALDLALEFRGERLYVPKDPAREPLIAKTIGEELAAKFCAAFWRTHIAMPMGIALEHRVRELAAQGELTKREIARLLRIREARVYAILQRQRDSRQGDLFETSSQSGT